MTVELVPGITPFVYLIVDRLKVQLPLRAQRWLPEISACFGLGMVLTALFTTGPYNNEDWLRYCIEGIFLGYAATGLHQAKKTKEAS